MKKVKELGSRLGIYHPDFIKAKKSFDPNYIRKSRPELLSDSALINSNGILDENYLLNLNEHIDYNLYVKGFFDFAPILLSIFFSRYCQRRGAFLDIGANIGATFLPQSHTGIEAIGIEASSTIANSLIRNLSLNPQSTASVLKLAVSDVDGEAIQLYRPSGNHGATSIYSEWNKSNAVSQAEKAMTTTIDSLARFRNDSHGFSSIKIDIEGSELNALRGGREFFNSSLAAPVIMEWRIDIFKNFQDPKDLIDEINSSFSLKYSVRCICANGNPYLQSLTLEKFDPSKKHENILLLPKTCDTSTIEAVKLLAKKVLVMDVKEKKLFMTDPS